MRRPRASASGARRRPRTLRCERGSIRRDWEAFAADERELQADFAQLSARIEAAAQRVDALAAMAAAARAERRAASRRRPNGPPTQRSASCGRSAAAARASSSRGSARAACSSARSRTAARSARLPADATRRRQRLTAELGWLDCGRRAWERAFARTIQEIGGLQAELQAQVTANCELSRARERLRTLQFCELAIRYRLHLAKEEARALADKSAHPVLLPQLLLTSAVYVGKVRHTQ
jgi:hypothetical protein